MSEISRPRESGRVDPAGRGAGQRVQENLKKAGYQTETYVRSHPGRFIAGACCLGLAAGFLLGRASKHKR